MLPEFGADGLLPVPPPVHTVDWDEFALRFGWTVRRRELLGGIERVGRNLRGAGVGALWIGGSFVTAKDKPGDFDGLWSPGVSSFDPTKIDPLLIDEDDLRTGRFRQKAKYGGELFPAGSEGDGSATFQQFFGQTRDGSPQGIVRLRLRDLP